MRLFFVLGVCCFLSNDVLGVHTKLHQRIYDSYRSAEHEVEMCYEFPDELKSTLMGIPELTVDNFFLVLHICACSMAREGYDDLFRTCLNLFEKTKGTQVVRDCLYYFEEMFCIEDTHELNYIAAGRLCTRVWAMIVFLNWNKAHGKVATEKDEIIRIYQECMQRYKTDPRSYGHWEENSGDDWCKAFYPEWGR